MAPPVKSRFTIKLKRVDDNDRSLSKPCWAAPRATFGRLGLGKLVGGIGNKLGASLMGAFDQFGTRLAENLGLTNPLDALRQGHPVPAYQVLVDGKDISAAIRPRLMSMTITDNRGFTADTIEITLDDSDGQLDMPRRAPPCAPSLAGKARPGRQGHLQDRRGGARRGPDVLTIRGKSADLRGGMNKLREQSWHQTTVSDIVSQVAARYQLTPCVGDSLKGQLIDHIDQASERDLAFLTRLAGPMCDGIATVKNGRLLFIKAGQGTTASGQPLPAITSPVRMAINTASRLPTGMPTPA